MGYPKGSPTTPVASEQMEFCGGRYDAADACVNFSSPPLLDPLVCFISSFPVEILVRFFNVKYPVILFDVFSIFGGQIENLKSDS